MMRCDFCEKGQNEVKIMISGLNGAGICSECVIAGAELLLSKMEQEYGEIKFKKIKESSNHRCKEETEDDTKETWLKGGR